MGEDKWAGWNKNVWPHHPLASVDSLKKIIVIDFVFLDSKVTAPGDCSHEVKRHLLLGRKAMTNLGSILKSRDITLLSKFHLVKTMVFPVVM